MRLWGDSCVLKIRPFQILLLRQARRNNCKEMLLRRRGESRSLSGMRSTDITEANQTVEIIGVAYAKNSRQSKFNPGEQHFVAVRNL